MFRKSSNQKNAFAAPFLLLTFSVLMTGGCAVQAAKGDEKTIERKSSAAQTAQTIQPKDKFSKSEIAVAPDSPADTVRVFYRNLREAKFRDALFLTNLRPAVEGLTDSELKDLQVDFASLARELPDEININGEIISGDQATVTAKLPDDETGKLQLQQIRLRRHGAFWTILTVDDEAEKIIEKEGKNYFFNLKIETHQREAKNMLDRIAKAQMVFATQNNGLYGETADLINSNFLPADVLSSDSTGYEYRVALSPDRKNYVAAARPAVYGKTGKLTFSFAVENGRTTPIKSADAGVEPVNHK